MQQKIAGWKLPIQTAPQGVSAMVSETVHRTAFYQPTVICEYVSHASGLSKV